MSSPTQIFTVMLGFRSFTCKGLNGAMFYNKLSNAVKEFNSQDFKNAIQSFKPTYSLGRA